MVEPKRNRASRLNLGKGFSSTFEIPSLIEAQKTSFKDFYEGGFKRLFDEINPVKDTMERMWTLEFKSFRYGEPYRGIEEAIAKGLSYEVPVYATVQLLNNKTGEIKEQEIFVADLPMMTDDGAFVVNGVRRVVTHQIVRAEGVLFEESEILPYRTLHKARIMPGRGPWYEIEVNKYNVISMRISPKRPRVLITELLRVLGYESDQEILKLFKDVDTHEEYKYIEATLARDFTKSKEDAIISIYNKLRPDESVTLDSAEKYIKSNFFSKRKFDLGKIGRYQLNRKKLIKINNGVEPSDDIDHLCNRRIRSVGEVLERQLLAGIRRLEKNIKDKMSLYGQDAKVTPSMLVGTKTVAASIQSFFGANQLSTFMDQTNILAELENKRKVTAAGPGGIVKDRATFSIREVHNSQYAKFDPVTSPESANIGVVTQLSILAKINEFGFLESPYRRVIKLVKNNKKDMLNRILSEDIKGVAKAGTLITSTVAEKIASKKDVKEVKVVPFISEEVDYFDALDEENKYISIPSINTDEHNNILETLVPVRHEGDFILEDVNLVDHVDVLTYQQAGLGMALIPFVSHDDAMRALAGANMQRQGVPLVKQEAPLIGTGVEEIIARQSNWGIFAEEDGEVIFVDAKKVTVNYKNTGIKDYKLVTFYRN